MAAQAAVKTQAAAKAQGAAVAAGSAGWVDSHLCWHWPVGDSDCVASGARSRHAAAPPPPMRRRQHLAPRYKITKKGMSKSAVRTMSGTKLIVDNTELKACDKACDALSHAPPRDGAPCPLKCRATFHDGGGPP